MQSNLTKGNIMKRIFMIDWALTLLFALTAYTGIKLHIAGHGNIHEIWHDWAVFHVIGSILFLVVTIFHITTHWNWYKGIFSRGIEKRSKVTIWLSAMFTFVAITGIILFYVEGANSPIGLWHYKIGILMSVFSIGHIIKRFPILRKSLGCLKN